MAIRAPAPPDDKASTPYLPPGPEALSFEQFQGINTSTSRAGVKDEEMWWCDGYLTIGSRLLRTFPGVGPRLFAAANSVEPVGTTISFFDFGNIGILPYCIVFMSNGSIYAINTITGAAARIAPAGTITNPSRLNVGMTQYGSQDILIVALQTDGYFIWDGITFFGPGDSFDSDMVPTGIGGNAIEIYAGRVWIASGPTITFSAPGSLIDFTSGSGGGQFTSTDSFLRIAYTELKQSNGFLYLIGDSSVNYISGVQTGGSPLTTTFTNQNADPEIGSPWPSSVDTFGRNIIFANAFGVHVSYGAAVTKVSEPLDGVYATVADFGGLVPSAAKATIYGKKVWFLLLPIIDPVSGQQVNKMLGWNGKIWTATGQDEDLTFIQSQEIASLLTAWGTDSNSIWPLFQSPSVDFTKTVQSRLWDRPVGFEALKSAGRVWVLGQYYDFESPEVTLSIDNERGVAAQATYTLDFSSGEMTWTGVGGAVMTWTGLGGATMTWLSASGGISVSSPLAVAQNGVLLGFTIETNCADWALVACKMQPEDTGYRG